MLVLSLAFLRWGFFMQQYLAATGEGFQLGPQIFLFFLTVPKY